MTEIERIARLLESLTPEVRVAAAIVLGELKTKNAKAVAGLMELATHLGVKLDDEMKYIDTNKKMETNISGVFAAGDICGPPWQMAKAVGEGCVAGLNAATFAKKVGKQ